MPEIVIYTTPICPYCERAKSLLKRKGASWKEIDITKTPGAREEMMEKSGGRKTVPQIFIGAAHIGGSDDLHALEREGRLDAML